MEVIGQYDFTIEHRVGRQHGNADGLSRRPCKQCGRQETTTEIEPRVEKEAEINQMTENLIRSIFWEPELSCTDIRQGQLADSTMSNILTAKENFPEERPKWETISQNSSSVKTYWSQWDQLEVHNGVLCKR